MIYASFAPTGRGFEQDRDSRLVTQFAAALPRIARFRTVAQPSFPYAPQIANTSAKYDYQIQTALLNYQAGALHATP